MSREFLLEVLEKFAQVTSIIVETARIKEDLDNSPQDHNLNEILERTKAQVENLHEHAVSVKVLLDKNKDIQKKSVVNGENANVDALEQSDSDKSSEKNENEHKPRIKLVDIKKLVEPRELIREHKKNPTKHVRIDETVVVITSSDEEQSKSKKSVSKSTSRNLVNSKSDTSTTLNNCDIKSARTVVRRKAAEKTIERNRKLQISTSSSESSDEEFLSRKFKEAKNGKRKAKELEKVTLSNTSSNSNDSDTESMKSTKQKNKDKSKKVEKTNIDSVQEDKDKETEEPSLIKDSELNYDCYVKLIRVPCEKLKEYYLEKLELLGINKLRDLTSLKRKRHRTASGSSSESRSSDENKKKHKEKPSSKKVPVEQSEDSSSEDLDATKDSLKPTESASEKLDLPNSNSDLANGNATNEMAEDALNLLNSDKEDSIETSDKEGSEADAPAKGDQNKKDESSKNEVEEDGKEQEGQKSNLDAENQTEKRTDLEKKDDAENDVQSCEEADGPKDAQNSESHDQTKETEDGESDTNDEQKKKDKSKSAWKKDKLLTAKLSSTDSDEELDKFEKKKEKMKNQETSSDDEPKLPKEKLKRGKKRRMKAILSDSDSDNKKDESAPQSSTSSSESEKEDDREKGSDKPKPRKRVKRVKDSSEDEDEEGISTRKQIRNIWGNDSLAETTKQAEAEEKERKARIVEKQKKYNQVYESGSELNAKVEKVVLDFDEKNEKELLRVDDFLVEKLKPHQASGVQFMWDACFESIDRAQTNKGSGCILAHCMGLGKTLQVIALSHTLLVDNEITNVKKVLVVSPLNTVLNWVSEFKQWVPDNECYEVYELVSFKQNFERQYQVKSWHRNGGVLIIGYDMFRNLSNPDNKRVSKKMKATFQEALVDPGPDLVICDEGHLLKNEKTNLSIAMNRIRTLRRIVLTGTPLQNNLKEYFCMVQFIKPNLLGTYKEYLNRFVNPIINGQYTDSTQHDIQIMRKRSHVLHKMLDGVVQRRDYSVLEPYLPPKFEYVLFLSLSKIQVKLYQHYMDHFARRSMDGSNKTSFLFVDYQALQRICAHPRVLLDKSIEMKLAREKMDSSEEDSEGSLKDFIDDDEEEETSSSSGNSSSDEDGGREKRRSAPKKRVTRAAAALAKDNGEEDPVEIVDLSEPAKKEWWQEYCDGDELNVIANGSKLFLLFEILKECEQIGDKVLVFSQSLYSLNIIEYFLSRVHDATQAGDTESVGGYSGSWCVGLDYFRLDGSSSCDNRSAWCKTFNNQENTRARLFLISTRAGGLGINLVAANRVIIFDVSWNPSHDIQSIYRVYRFGQTKPCYIYRFVTMGAMEMKIYERQVTKQAISKRVIDEQQIDRHYNQNDLAELYRFESDPGERPIPMVPKDVLLGELLQKFEERIFKFHEHQSLLENKHEECLNEEERKAAWEEFENEKKQRTNVGTGYVKVNNMELALAKILRQEYPTLNEEQIRLMLPTLHAQLQEQVTRGDLTLYKRVQQEIQIIQAVQTQRIKEQFYQQQMRALQQQQVLEAMKMHTNFGNNFLNAFNVPGTSGVAAPTANLNPSEVIDLND